MINRITKPWESEYRIEKTEIVAETHNLRVLDITLSEGQFVPWHYHSKITDIFFCITGELQIETKNYKTIIHPGESYQIIANVPHRVSNKSNSNCKFLLVQGIGAYDYIKTME